MKHISKKSAKSTTYNKSRLLAFSKHQMNVFIWSKPYFILKVFSYIFLYLVYKYYITYFPDAKKSLEKYILGPRAINLLKEPWIFCWIHIQDKLVLEIKPWKMKEWIWKTKQHRQIKFSLCIFRKLPGWGSQTQVHYTANIYSAITEVR